MKSNSVKKISVILMIIAMFFAFMPASMYETYAAAAGRAKKVTRVTPSGRTATMRTGTYKRFKCKLSPKKLKKSARKVTWKSSKPSVASVSRTGVVKAKKTGKTVITAKAVKGGKKTSWKVTVKKSNVKAKKQAVRQVLVSPEWVKSVIDGNQPESKDYRILEVAYGPEKDDADYKDGHVPGAVHCDTNYVEESGDEDYYNLLSASKIEEDLLDLGVTSDTTVIVYGDDPSATARVAYACLYEGVKNVKFMNGSDDAWHRAHYTMEKKSNTAEAEDSFGVNVPAHPEYQMSIDEVKDKLKNDSNFRLVSIRSEDEWLGKTSGYSYITRAGEPKGAVWGHGGSDPYHMEDYETGDDKTLVTPAGMEKMWKKYNVKFNKDNELAFYCGTGWRASIPFILCYQAGYKNITMYDGGWYQWQSMELDKAHGTDSSKNEVQVGDPDSGNVIYTTVDQLPTDKAAGQNENQNG